ncbi:CPCC family cysteine-rich protein [Curvivirga sp.]|uniref:CPCC family cysteine-rich protein n=1 Tax=Curvivirga sp. TaxID=2856848 RepID=UPI003B5981AE
MENTQKYQCLCCGYRTLDEPATGNYDICPVCFWEDDPIQASDPDYKGGANQVSLIQARSNYSVFGASDKDLLEHVRPPMEHEKI